MMYKQKQRIEKFLLTRMTLDQVIKTHINVSHVIKAGEAHPI